MPTKKSSPVLSKKSPAKKSAAKKTPAKSAVAPAKKSGGFAAQIRAAAGPVAIAAGVTALGWVGFFVAEIFVRGVAGGLAGLVAMRALETAQTVALPGLFVATFLTAFFWKDFSTGFWAIFCDAWRTLRAGFWPIVAATAVLTGLGLGVSAGIDGLESFIHKNFPRESADWVEGVGITLLIFLMLLQIPLFAAIVRWTRDRGSFFATLQKTRIGEIARLIGTAILVGIFALWPIVLVGLLATLGSVIQIPGVSFAVLGLGLLAVLFAVWQFIRLGFAMPAIVLDDLGPFAAMKKSRALVAGRWWAVFGRWAVLAIVLGAIFLVAAAIAAGIAVGGLALGEVGSTVGMGIGGAIFIAVGLVLDPFQTVFLARFFAALETSKK